MNMISAIENTVPIASFNQGLAGKIFSEVKQSGTKVVMKNDMPECILLSPAEYMRLMEEINDAHLLETASQRLKGYDPNTVISENDIKCHFGITDEELAEMDEVELE